jgi:predicted flap endonuclease-1-like 5' DNA nuclease
MMGRRTLGLFWQIVGFLLVAATLGFVIGWLARGARAQGAQVGLASRHAGAEAALREERDRLRTELATAREAQSHLAEARKLADTRGNRVRELEAAEASNRERIARLEQELGETRASGLLQGGAAPLATAPAAEPDRAGGVPPPVEPVRGMPPPRLPGPEGEPDDLKRISGIGPGIEKTLHELGIYHFRQIAELTPDNVAWIDQRLRFRGRVEREDWIGQAQRLARGEAIDQA